nr:unnamed protein product [Digitaria exilis]
MLPSTTLRTTTGFGLFAVSPNAHGKGPKTHGKAFAVTRITANPARQKTYRQRDLCREPYITLSANLCPPALVGPARLFAVSQRPDSRQREHVCLEPESGLTANMLPLPKGPKIA